MTKTHDLSLYRPTQKNPIQFNEDEKIDLENKSKSQSHNG